VAHKEDSAYMADLREAELRTSHPLPHLSLITITTFITIALVWASFATVEEVTSGFGKVIPSGHVQVIQNLEGGILSKLVAREGQIVKKDQILLRIDDTSASATYRDYETHRAALVAGITRLEAEAENKPLVFPQDLRKKFADMIRTERNLYQSRKETLAASLKSLRDSYAAAFKEYQGLQGTVTRLAAEAEGKTPRFPADLRKQQPLLVQAEMALYRARRKTLLENIGSTRRSLDLKLKELKLNKPLVAKGIVSEIEALRLEREVNDLRGQIAEKENSYRQRAAQELSEKKGELLRLQRQTTDLKARIDDRVNQFRTAAREDLNIKNAELARLEEAMVSTQDRVRRTVVRSPVRGTVKKVYVNTIGGVIKPGMDILEIVPLDDTLVVEAKIKPTDIAFISPQQKATVKITAYDYSTYGGLDGLVEHISADTITEDSGEAYYLVRVRTEKNHILKDGKPLPIIPGMTASVDILTGKRTILQYLVNPFLKVRHSALRER
jgi:adhesin transport system membrane fusion protein